VDDLHRLLSEKAIGRRSTLTLLRDFQKIDLPVIPQENN
jgi:hypothetical protein